MEGQITLASAGELKPLLVEWLAAPKDLEIDLQRVQEMDITIMQLLWSAMREAAQKGAVMAVLASHPAAAAARDAGFAQLPGFHIQE